MSGLGGRVLYVWPNERGRSLGDLPGGQYPARKMRRVAFLSRIVATNAWIMERQRGWQRLFKDLTADPAYGSSA
jgi:hypothetical protein